MERFQRVRLLAHAHKFERLAGDGADGEGRAAARIAVHLRKDGSRDAQALMKLVGGLDGVLAGHSVGDEEDFGGVEEFLERGELGHELVIDVQTARGVDQQDVSAGLDRFFARGAGEIEGLRLFRSTFVDRKLQIPREDAQLLARGGAIHVDRNHDRRVLFFGKIARQLGGRGGFTGALQADDEEYAGRLGCGAQAGLMLAQHLDHLVADDLDDLLGRRKRGEHFLAHGLFLDGFDELFDNTEVDVGLEQGHADLAQRGLHIGLAEFAFSAEVFEDSLELVA